jgi:hypothetical protein
MTIPIRPGTAARLGLRPPARPPSFELTVNGFTAEEERRLRATSNDWFAQLAAQPGWSHGDILPVTGDDWEIRFGPPIPPPFAWPPDEPRRRWWHRRNR